MDKLLKMPMAHACLALCLSASVLVSACDSAQSRDTPSEKATPTEATPVPAQSSPSIAPTPPKPSSFDCESLVSPVKLQLTPEWTQIDSLTCFTLWSNKSVGLTLGIHGWKAASQPPGHWKITTIFPTMKDPRSVTVLGNGKSYPATIFHLPSEEQLTWPTQLTMAVAGTNGGVSVTCDTTEHPTSKEAGATAQSRVDAECPALLTHFRFDNLGEPLTPDQ